MSHIFFSYSREDTAFAERLQRALEAQGRSVWRDTKGILPSADWQDEIRRALIAADTFLFIVSPGSIGSLNCAAEIEQAVANRTRIIGVVIQGVDPRTDRLPAPIAKINLIFFETGTPSAISDNFDAGFRELNVALDTDFEYWRRAGELADRTRQWQERTRDRSLLLRGKDLEDAQRWLALGANRIPPPSPTQAEFIDFSRRASSRQQRRIIIWLFGATCVFLILAIIATSLGIAAYLNGRVASSRQFAGQSNTARLEQNRPDLALLYGVEGLQTNDNANTRNSLIAALTSEPHLEKLLQVYPDVATPAQYATTVAYSADGRALFASTSDGRILRWDVSSGGQQTYMPNSKSVTFMDALAVSSDGNSVAFVNGDGLSIWTDIGLGIGPKPDTASKLLASTSSGTLDYYSHVLALGFAPGNTLIAVAPCDQLGPQQSASCTGAHIQVWDTSSLQLRTSFDLPVPATLDATTRDVAALSPDGTTLAISCANDAAKPSRCPHRQVQVWDLHDLQHPPQTPMGSVESDVELGRLVMSPAPASRKVAATCKWIAPTGCRTVQVWDFTQAENKVSAVTVPVTARIYDAAFDPSGRHLATAGCEPSGGCANGAVQLWDLTASPIKQLTDPISKHANAMTGLVFSPDGEHLVTEQANDNELMLWNLQRVDPVTDLVLASPTNAHLDWYQTALSPDGNFLAELVELESGDALVDSLNIVRMSDHTQIAQATLDSQYGNTVIFSTDGSRVAVLTNSTVYIWGWDGQSLTAKSRITEQDTSYYFVGVDLSKDGKRVAVVNNPIVNKDNPASNDRFGQIELYDGDTGTALGSPLTVESNNPYQLALSPDGTSVATAYYPSFLSDPGLADYNLWYDKDITIWNVKDMSQPHPSRNVHGQTTDAIHETAFGGVIYSPDGRYIASLDIYGVAIVWDARSPTYDVVGKFVAFERQRAKLAVIASFSPDSHYLVLTGGNVEEQQDVISVYDIEHNQPYVEPINNALLQDDQSAWVVYAQLSRDDRHLIYTVEHEKIGESIISAETYVRDIEPVYWEQRACNVVAPPDLIKQVWDSRVKQDSPPSVCFAVSAPDSVGSVATHAS